MVLRTIKNIDRQKYIISLVLDAIDIDIDPRDGRIFHVYNPESHIVSNSKILRLDFGEPFNNLNYGLFNPILKEDHAQMLITLIIQTQLMEEDDKEYDEDNATNFDVQTMTSDLEDGKTLYHISIIDRNNNDTILGEGEHENSATATFLACCNYIYNIGGLSIKDLEDIVDSIKLIHDQIAQIESMSYSKRKTFVKDLRAKQKGEVNTPEIYEDFDAIEKSYRYAYDIPVEIPEEKPWMDEDDDTFKESDFENEDELLQAEIEAESLVAEVSETDPEFTNEDFDDLSQFDGDISDIDVNNVFDEDTIEVTENYQSVDGDIFDSNVFGNDDFTKF